MVKILNSTTITKDYAEDGSQYNATISLKLYQPEGNKKPYFSFTTNIKEKRKNGRYADYVCGCCHDEIAKLLPDFAKFLPLHLCDNNGMPMYTFENGTYFIKECLGMGAEYLRISEDEARKLPLDNKEKYFKALEDMGILDRWQNEANECIKWIEEHK